MKKQHILLATAITLQFFTLNTEAQTYPPQTTSLDIGAMPALTRPEYLGSVVEPTLGTRITRVADQSAFSTTQRVVTHNYATMETWNSDGTVMMLTEGQYPYVFIDGHNYSILGRHYVPQGATWSPTQPNIMYGIGSNSPAEKDFVSYDITTRRFTVLKTFDAYTGLRYVGEYHISNDGKYTCLFGYKGEDLYLISFDISRREIIAERLLGRLSVGDNDPNGVNAIMMSQKGNYIAIVYKSEGTGTTQGVHLYDRNLNYIRFLMDSINHSDMGMDENGDEVYVGQNGATQRAIFKLRLSDNEKTIVWDDAKMGYNQHISCRNNGRPGWAYVSDFEMGYAARPNENKVYAVKLDGSQKIEIYAWARRSETIEYDRGVMVCPSPDGSKVIFRSDWGDGSPIAIVYSYVANMPVSTDRTDPVGSGRLSVRGEHTSNANERRRQAFDNNARTKWLDFSAQSWIGFQFDGSARYAVNKYSITSANDAPGRDPRDWKLYGTNVTTNPRFPADYALLDSQSNVLFNGPSNGRFLKKEFFISNTTAYRAYRLEITANTSVGTSNPVNIIQLAEIELFAPPCTTCRTASAEVESSPQPEAFTLKLHPNPANREVSIDLSGFEGESAVQVKISDMNGKLLVSQPVQIGEGVKQVILPIRHLSQGLFLVRVQGRKTAKTAKLTITR